MKKHICKQCNRVYEYCRGCLLSPISYKENGYCSVTCYEASKIKAEPIVEEIVETISVEDIVPAEPEVEAIVEEVLPIEVEPEAIAQEESPTVVEPTIKKETNTYKKKKNKYKDTSSL